MSTESSGNVQNTMQVLNIPIEDIIPNRFQPRLNFDDSSLKELAVSIKEHGIIQPLVLRNIGEKYEIIAGERRYKAAKMAGLTTVPAIISTLDDRNSAEVAIVENIQRRSLSSIEEAKSYKALLDKGYITQEDLARKMGLSQSAISNKLRLLSLSDNVQKALIEGKISERHARSLLQISSLEAQDRWLKKIVEERLTVKELDRRIREEQEKLAEQREKIKKEENEEIPIIEVAPNINVIRQNATDIVAPSKYQDISPSPNSNKPSANDEKIPNKFFNYLEDVSINMNINEPNENSISPDKVLQNNNLENKIIEDNAIENKVLDNPISENKAPDKTILETAVPNDTVLESKVSENNVSEDKISDNVIPENEVSDNIISESKALDKPVLENEIPTDPGSENDFEEIEMLDFLEPDEPLKEEKVDLPKEDSTVEIPKPEMKEEEENSLEKELISENKEKKELKDMTIANVLIDSLVTNLQNNNYDVKLSKEETDAEQKYIFTIKKD